MSAFIKSPVLRVITLPLIGAIGALVAMVYPLGHKAFCAGLPLLVS